LSDAEDDISGQFKKFNERLFCVEIDLGMMQVLNSGKAFEGEDANVQGSA
jgi:hypothetical protein